MLKNNQYLFDGAVNSNSINFTDSFTKLKLFTRSSSFKVDYVT